MNPCALIAIPIVLSAVRIQDVKPPGVPPVKLPAAPSTRPIPVGAPTIDGAVLSAALQSIPSIRREHLMSTVEADGTVWVIGASYKASFGVSGATYIPFLGTKAPKNHPVAFTLESVTAGGVPVAFDPGIAPVRDGDTIVFDRGNVDELYELGLDSIEQKFVVESLPPSIPSGGELVLRIAVESDLVKSETADHLEFSNELGSVRYGRATAIDAAGASVPASTTHADGTIEIRVPESFLSTARFPLVIDPVIGSFYVEFNGQDYVPDVAYDPTSGRFLVVFEEVVSASDHDVYGYLFDSDGNYHGYYAVDGTTDFWAAPKVAGNFIGQQWLVVAAVGTGTRTIRGRTLSATSTAYGPVFTISEGGGYDCFAPDVGGDPVSSGPTFYCVVWERVYDPADHDIHAQLVDADSNLVGGTIHLEDALAFDGRPSISKSDGHFPFDTQNWNVVWERTLASSDHDIHGAQIKWNGAITNPPFPIDADGDDDTAPTASSLLDGASGPRNWLVAYEGLYGDHDIVGRMMNGATTVNLQGVSYLEAVAGSGAYYEEQLHPDADSDGTSFAVAYTEQCSSCGGDYDIYMATLTPVGSVLKLSEGHAKAFPITDFASTDRPQVCSTYSGGGGNLRFMAVCGTGDTASHFPGDVVGAFYDTDEFTSYCWPATDGVRICPCGNPPSTAGRGCNNSSSTGGAILSETGTASLAADTVQFQTQYEKPTALSVVAQFTGLNPAGTIFGQGVRCTNGTLKRLYAKSASGGTIRAPQAGDLSVSARSAALGDVLSAGATRYYLVYYRDATVLGGCPASSTFNSTQGGAITWRP